MLVARVDPRLDVRHVQDIQREQGSGGHEGDADGGGSGDWESSTCATRERAVNLTAVLADVLNMRVPLT